MFPDPETALTEPNGLLCSGGDLRSDTLLAAYRQGVFPWFDDDRGPLLWWSPDPRAVILPARFHISRRLARRLRAGEFDVLFDHDFDAVVAGCAEPRGDHSGTWITPNMQRAYGELHRLGWAHCVSVYRDGELAGGVYGVSIGRLFCAESMFSRVTDASKAALAVLTQRLDRWEFAALDCQVMNPHLASLGAEEIPRSRYLALLSKALQFDSITGAWPDELKPENDSFYQP